MKKKNSSQLVAELTAEFTALRDDEQAAHLMRFFKTSPGQYGEGDRFLGIKVPVTRSIVKRFRDRVALADCEALLDSEWHEIRLSGLLLMVALAAKMARSHDADGLRDLVGLFDRRLERANNWDLVDLSVRDIMASYWQCIPCGKRDRLRFLSQWADSGNLWRERAAMVATYATIRMGSLDETFALARRFIDHSHDLMHKASGWMLREAGKKDPDALRGFLREFHTRLPRTALRYAIEHFSEGERREWMRRG